MFALIVCKYGTIINDNKPTPPPKPNAYANAVSIGVSLVLKTWHRFIHYKKYINANGRTQ